MRIGEVIGKLSLSKAHPALKGSRWLLVQPRPASAETAVVFDELGAGEGTIIGFSEGAEAAVPFMPEKKPIDAYASCQLDEELEPPAK